MQQHTVRTAAQGPAKGAIRTNLCVQIVLNSEAHCLFVTM